MKINQSTTFDAQLRDENEDTYVNFTGSVDAQAVPSVNYYISNQNTYLANVKAFRSALVEFQNAVFDAADAKQAELAEEESGNDKEEVAK